MPTGKAQDAVVIGGGPNGLAAAITLARAGYAVQLFEAEATVGGGCRSAELTLPGFVHDVCSAVYPLGPGSPFFSQLPLERHGLRWVKPDVELAHPLDDGAVLVMRDVEATAAELGSDRDAYLRLLGPVVHDWNIIINELTGPFRIPLDLATLRSAVRFGVRAIQPATVLARRFATPEARALLAGCSAHSMIGLSEPLSGAFGLMLMAGAHAVGWPLAAGGAGRIADALAAHLKELGGTIVTGRRITSLDQLPPHGVLLLDLAPRQVLELASERLRGRRGGAWYLRQLQRFRYGPGAFKIDLALAGPIPWRAPRVGEAATVHLGGTFEEIVAAEDAVVQGRIPERPFVILVQPSRFDPTRAPDGRSTAWAYCHVPNGCTAEMTDRILAQIERFAPGFRERILATSTRGPAELERYNANYVGGDIGSGRADWRQFFTRPTWWPSAYHTPDPRMFLCSSSTPPGPGVHGLCGWHAAQSVLRAHVCAPSPHPRTSPP